jgi:hypothetical protein
VVLHRYGRQLTPRRRPCRSDADYGRSGARRDIIIFRLEIPSLPNVGGCCAGGLDSTGANSSWPDRVVDRGDWAVRDRRRRGACASEREKYLGISAPSVHRSFHRQCRDRHPLVHRFSGRIQCLELSCYRRRRVERHVPPTRASERRASIIEEAGGSPATAGKMAGGSI